MCHCPCAGLELCAFADRWCSGLCVLEESNARPRDTSHMSSRLVFLRPAVSAPVHVIVVNHS